MPQTPKMEVHINHPNGILLGLVHICSQSRTPNSDRIDTGPPTGRVRHNEQSVWLGDIRRDLRLLDHVEPCETTDFIRFQRLEVFTPMISAHRTSDSSEPLLLSPGLVDLPPLGRGVLGAEDLLKHRVGWLLGGRRVAGSNGTVGLSEPNRFKVCRGCVGTVMEQQNETKHSLPPYKDVTNLPRLERFIHTWKILTSSNRNMTSLYLCFWETWHLPPVVTRSFWASFHVFQVLL